jgi:hypothetical protein
VAAKCPEFEATFGTGCRFLPAYQAPSLVSRVPERTRP